MFKDIIARFQAKHRPAGWQLSDFQRIEKVQAWVLSPLVKDLFKQWLQKRLEESDSDTEPPSAAQGESTMEHAIPQSNAQPELAEAWRDWRSAWSTCCSEDGSGLEANNVGGLAEM